MIYPRVIIDARYVGPVTHGFSRYTTQLAQGLSLLKKSTKLLYEPVFIVSSQGKTHPSFLEFETLVANAPFLSPEEWIELPRLIKKIKANLYHSPTFASLLYCPCPWIVTVHDLNHLTYGAIKEKLYYHFVLRPFIRKAKAVMTVSDFSKKRIATWSGISADSINIVYNSIDPVFRNDASLNHHKQTLKNLGLEEGKYFICLANDKPHKNVSTLMRAYQAKKYPWKMVVNIKEYAGIPGVCVADKLSDEKTHALLSGAGALVSPSLYEGFGLLPVEGACMGLPLIISRIPAHEESLVGLTSDEVCWVDPLDMQGWIGAMEAACAKKLKVPSIQSRELLIKRYDARAMGEKMDQIYRRVLLG